MDQYSRGPVWLASWHGEDCLPIYRPS